MIRGMCGVSMKHIRRSEELRKLVGVELITMSLELELYFCHF